MVATPDTMCLSRVPRPDTNSVARNADPDNTLDLRRNQKKMGDRFPQTSRQANRGFSHLTLATAFLSPSLGVAEGRAARIRNLSVERKIVANRYF